MAAMTGFLRESHGGARNRQSGMGLVEVIVAAGILMVVSAAVVRVMSTSNKNQRMLHAVSVRNGKVRLANTVLEANAPRILSLAINPNGPAPLCQALKECINNSAMCPPAPQYGSCSFYDFGNLKITGTEFDPLRMTLNGGVCASASPQCPLEVVGKFRRDPVNPGNVEVWVAVRQAANIQVAGLPRLAEFDGLKENAAVKVPISRVKIACSENERLLGYAADGSPDCRPLVTGVVKSTEKDVCKDGVCCEDGTFMRGITKDGRPICSAYPSVWQFNNLVFCHESDRMDTGHCNAVRDKMVADRMVPCPDSPHGLLCDPAAASFCYKMQDDYFYTVTPNNSGGRVVGEDLMAKQDMGPFLRNCQQNGNYLNCSPGGNVVDLKAVKIPIFAERVIRVMRCMRPVRVP